jgi:hypothetical protein
MVIVLGPGRSGKKRFGTYRHHTPLHVMHKEDRKGGTRHASHRWKGD